jgi:hypothetical protein
MEPVIAVYDACVLYSSFLRDFLIRLAIHGRRQGSLRAKWTGRIHREWIDAVLRRRPELREKQEKHKADLRVLAPKIDKETARQRLYSDGRAFLDDPHQLPQIEKNWQFIFQESLTLPGGESKTNPKRKRG